MDIMKPKNIKYWYGNTERYRLLFKNNKINTVKTIEKHRFKKYILLSNKG